MPCTNSPCFVTYFYTSRVVVINVSYRPASDVCVSARDYAAAKLTCQHASFAVASHGVCMHETRAGFSEPLHAKCAAGVGLSVPCTQLAGRVATAALRMAVKQGNGVKLRQRTLLRWLGNVARRRLCLRHSDTSLMATNCVCAELSAY